MSKEKALNAPIEEELPRVNAKTVANALRIDHRTVTKHLKEILNIDVTKNSFELTDVFAWIHNYCQTFDRRKAENKVKVNNPNEEPAELSNDYKLYGEIHLKDPARFKAINEGVFAYIKSRQQIGILVNEDDVRRLIFELLNGYSLKLRGFTNDLKNQGISAELLDQIDPLIYELQQKLYQDSLDFAEKIRKIEGEKISISQAADGLGLKTYAIAPFPVEDSHEKGS